MRQLLLLTFAALTIKCSALELSDSSRISLLTCAPGGELYSAFGHSAIRVSDFQNDMDIVFNYGTFDFGQPDFYFNFCMGRMMYMLSVEHYQNFRYGYIFEERAVSEQELLLTAAERKKIFDFLVWNAQSENKNYRYDFLFDNCSSRIRDVFENELEGRLFFDYSTMTTTPTFRDLIHDYSIGRDWEQWGMSFLIGLPVDVPTTPRQQMFLPDYLQIAFDNAYVIRNGDTSKLCKPIEKVLDLPPVAIDTPPVPPRKLFLWLFLFYIITRFALRMIRLSPALPTYFFLTVLSLFGWMFLFLWFATEHSTTAQNINLFWCNPFYLILMLAAWRKWRLPMISRAFLLFALVCLAFLLLSLFGWVVNHPDNMFLILLATVCCIDAASIVRKKYRWKHIR